jgi:hypothetical protein
MSMEVFDPTTSSEQEAINYAPRPQDFQGLKVGLVDNTKYNSRVLLEKVAERLQAKYGMEMVHIDTKQSASHHVEEGAVGTFKTKADFVIAGIGD